MSNQARTSDSTRITQSALTNRAQNFMRRRVAEVKQGGFPVMAHYAIMAVGLSLALLPVLFIRLLRPLVVVRFGELATSRIGPFASIPEVYLSEGDSGMRVGRFIDVFYHQSSVSNQQLKKMWNRTLTVTGFAKYMRLVNDRLPGRQAHQVPRRIRPEMDIHNVLESTKPHVSFTPAEERFGQLEIQRVGVPEGAPFVCFHCRDSAYLETVFQDKWYLRQRHDVRDASVDNYIPAMDEMTRRAYYALRMGAVVQDRLDSENPRIIDYAAEYRTDFLDIYLGAKCKFFVASASGLGTGVPMLFRTPTAYVNWLTLEIVNSWSPNDLFIPKKLWLKDEKRLLGFPEIFSEGIGRWTDGSNYQRYGIETIENTAEEITALVMEMDQRLDGTWEPGEDDEELQARFWSLYNHSELHGIIRSRIGAEFLRRNRELLD